MHLFREAMSKLSEENKVLRLRGGAGESPAQVERLTGMAYVNYVRNLAQEMDRNIFVVPWRSAIIRNSDDDGSLMLPSSLGNYHLSQKCMWVELKCTQFVDNGAVYAVMVCCSCSSMKSILSLGSSQRKPTILALRCHHSEAFMILKKEWETELELPDVLPRGPSNLFTNGELKSLILRGQETDKLFLAIVQKSGILSILHTICRSMKQPVCSKCSTCPCPCLKYLKGEDGKKRRREEADVEEVEIEEVEGEKDGLPWSRKRQRKTPVHNYDDTVKQNLWYEEYGCNKKTILFPISRDPERCKAWKDRLAGKVWEPPAEGMRADPDPGAKCDNHGNMFDKAYQIETSQHIVVYDSQSERIFKCATYAVGTGICRCLFQLDGDPYQLWHIKKGCFIELSYLNSYLMRHLGSGSPANAEYASRSHFLASIGLQTSLTVTEFQKAVAGFRALLSFPADAFTCPSCSKQPKYLVFDGTDLGPAQKKVDHLKELEKPGDDEALVQGGYFKDRTFMVIYRERQLVCSLLTGTISLDEFCAENFTSDEGKKVQELVRRLNSTAGSLSQAYKRFLANICKGTSVAGLLQVTSKEPLKTLKKFCLKELDIGNIAHSSSLILLRREIPPMLDMLEQIRKEEETNFLPADVSTIVLTLLRIRSQTFSVAERRQTSDYTEWDGVGDHPTAFYPDFPLRSYPQTYTSRQRI